MTRAIRILSLPIAIALAFGHQVVHAQQAVVDQFEKRTFTHDGLNMPYRLFVPVDYDSTSAYPLVMTFHGAGERGTDNERHITAHRLATSWADPDNQAGHPAFVLSPQLPSTLRWTMDLPVDQSTFSTGELAALAILDSLEREFNIDPDRIYLAGISLGGHAVWDLIARIPARFAAAVPTSGNADPTQAANLLHMPIWTFHGESDTVVDPAGARGFIQTSEDLGRDVVYTECRRSPVSASNFDCPDPISNAVLADTIAAHADLIFSAPRNAGHGPWAPWFDHPLLNDWVFSKRRVDPDAVTLLQPTGNDVVTGRLDVTWDTTTGDPADSVEVWLSVDRGRSWRLIGGAAAGDGEYSFDSTGIPDAAVAKIRLVTLDQNGRVYSRETGDTFSIDNTGDGLPYLEIDDEPLRFSPRVTDDRVGLNVVAADPEQQPLHTTIFYSVDGGVTFTEVHSDELTSSPGFQPIEIELASLPNSSTAVVRLDLSDGSHTISESTAPFEKVTPRFVNDYFEHVAGDGVGTVTLHFVEPERLTGHRYQVTIDDSDPDAKVYSVHDLDDGTTVLSGIPLSDGVRESPIFEGMTLVVEDLQDGAPNLEKSGWIEGDSDLAVVILGGSVQIAILRVDLLATEDDYEIAITDDISDTTITGFGLPAVETYFNVTSRSDGLKRRLLYRDEGDNGRLGGGDRIYILEPNDEGELAPAWEMRFSQTSSTILPEPGDKYLFVPLRSLSSEDIFEFIAMEGVGVDDQRPETDRPSVDVFPNPFAGPINVAFYIPDPANVEISVYDVLGRQVGVLASGRFGQGEHRVTSTARVAAGLHLVRMTVTGQDHVDEVISRSAIGVGVSRE